MQKATKFSFIGGDLRQIIVMNLLCDDGYSVKCFALNPKDDFKFSENIKIAPSLEQALNNADVVALPLPVTSNGKTLKAILSENVIYIDEVLKHINSKQVIIAGKPGKAMQKFCSHHDIKLIDYFAREEFSVLNAIPAVEGALSIAINETAFTIHDSKCLVLGYGRIGKLLSKNLFSLGAFVSVASKKCSDLAWVKAHGYSAIFINELINYVKCYDIIFNTIPHVILDSSILSKIKPQCLVIDLASKPGGVDFQAASKLGVKVIWALSLPGKVAPITAGHIVKNTFLNILKELEV